MRKEGEGEAQVFEGWLRGWDNQIDASLLLASTSSPCSHSREHFTRNPPRMLGLVLPWLPFLT